MEERSVNRRDCLLFEELNFELVSNNLNNQVIITNYQLGAQFLYFIQCVCYIPLHIITMKNTVETQLIITW
jgi:hypothetical protein